MSKIIIKLLKTNKMKVKKVKTDLANQRNNVKQKC